MNKVICLFLCILIMIGLIACSNNDIKDTNEIHLVDLTKEQKEILNLVGINNDIEIYKLKVDNSFKSISIWLETYQDGELISEITRMNTQVNSNEGKIAIMVDKTDNYDWRVSYQNSNGLSSCLFETKGEFEVSGDYSTSSGGGALNEPIKIISDREIVLRVYLFEDGNEVAVFDNQYYVDHPEILEKYDYVYLLKCCLSEKEVGGAKQ